MQLYKQRIPCQYVEELKALHATVLQSADRTKGIASVQMTSVTKQMTSVTKQMTSVTKQMTSVTNAPRVQELLDLSSELLSERRLAFDATRYMVEFWSYEARGRPVSSELGWHIDDSGAVPFNTYTLIYYVHKDTGLQGGDLFVRDGIFGAAYRVPIDTGDLIMLRGDVWHRPESITGGHGCRDCIVVQLRRLAA